MDKKDTSIACAGQLARQGPRPFSVLLSLAILILAAHPSNLSSLPARQPKVYLLTINGIINPLSARYLERGIREAYTQGAQAVVLQLDTPGGLESSMRNMVASILGSPLPVLVFVAPSAARAASAGMFITIAAHIAAMAPSTNIGAAHPVALGDRRQQQEKGTETSPSMAKVVQDAAAFARGIASHRHRNSQWAEKAVINSVSVSAEEALKLNVIDLLARDLAELLHKVNGRTVVLEHGEALVLVTAQANIVNWPMNLAERVLTFLTDPNLAYMLMTLGFIGIVAELYNPGLLIPGLGGTIALLLAFAALGSLPLNWAGLVFIILGLILLVVEIYSEGSGPLAVIGLSAFVLGSLFLYRPMQPVSPAFPKVHIDLWLIGTMAAIIGGFLLLVVRAVYKSRRLPLVSGETTLINTIGTAISDLTPRGRVEIGGEHWTAEAQLDGQSAMVKRGQKVQVVGVEGVTLRVKEMS